MPEAARAPFGARLAAAMDDLGPLCVGIDPHSALLAAWGLGDDVVGLREFSLRVVDAVGGRVAAVKPQAAFYERHGSAGVAVLEETIAAARAAGTLCIVDAKRGDIGSTMGAYAEAFLRDGSPLAGDALTVSPYLGFGSLTPAAELAAQTGRGLFVLCLTSNKEGFEVQHARTADGVTLAASVAAQAAVLNAGATPLGSVGLVVGATIGDAVAATGTDLEAVNGPLLAPGVGAQGAGATELATVFGNARRQVLASSSRGVLSAGPDTAALRAAAEAAVGEARAALRG
ncbi:orotidine 5'-phosphate decarboxylase [Xylanimonas cellulosilytica DSM 15894]|uniref:Orotidine 5'-phosphate decarboxylase n=1 Tax=Xylanimonas cellulosilytica (strain DSM 15894 / JCM 12276 / CECT 5975 / KCTC 9989 / LMG 20990 / NBRC 107835 / XIL07) TaxID=446471 RepID=D1BSP4_XYLCX|nr:orotidine-5'-phosphate decarboxylase [Xylanimonas cellulosilytica]ACZ30736.1 orotidine 5'-phosphate decarboxylase [Xylanimonas cellulosilytica DSM 15894]